MSAASDNREGFGALYLHVPFCARRCRYCDFATEAVDREDERCIAAMDAYVEQLVVALRRASKAGLLGTVRSVYIGGGTPTVLGHARLTQLAYTIGLSVDVDADVEFTVEANPESFTAEMARDLFALGVNRISFGVQSFDDGELALLGRMHDADGARCALSDARERFDNLSIDLMCGIPGQTMASWERSLDEAVALAVPHVSVYPLTIEEGTPFQALVASGKMPEPDEDMQADMMERAEAVLCAAGLVRYEVASYARVGFESRHNRAYWHGVPYLGLGRGASSMFPAALLPALVDARVLPGLAQAASQVRDGASRIRFSTGLDGAPALETLDEGEACAEDLMLAMRCVEGLGGEQIARATALLPRAEATLRELEEEGLVERAGSGSGERIVPTERGWLMGNRIYGALWDCRNR